MRTRPSIAVILDSPDENWMAMNYAGEMLLTEWKTSLAADVKASAFSVDLPRFARRIPHLDPQRAFNFDRGAGRFVVYPPIVARERWRHDFFHVLDHSYAHLVHVLPHHQTGIFCHDLDAFRAVLEPEKKPRALWLRLLERILLRGLASARVVFFTTNTVRDQIERFGIVPASRLVRAPYGIAAEFRADPAEDATASALVRTLGGGPFVLHVGSAVQRKRLDVLFEAFARLSHRYPDLRLIQAGALLTGAQRDHIARLRIGEKLVTAGKLGRVTLAALYHQAKAVLVTSEAEGFGLPVIEALACGAPVFASDIPVLREVGEDCAVFCKLGDPDHWAAVLGQFFDGELGAPPRAERLGVAAKYSWKNHARTILDTYRSLD